MMKTKMLAVAGAAFGLALSATASFAASLEPGETMGIAALSPLPEGVFFLDNENYGKQDGAATRLGVNIPLVVWSTPWSFYNTRIELLAAIPFAHLDGAVNQVSAITQAYGAIFAHDFGNGLSGGLATIIRTPDPSANISGLTGRTKPQADIRGGLYYSVQGWHFYETSWYTGYFGQTNYLPAGSQSNESIGVDFSASKTLDKFELGFVGFAWGDVNRAVAANPKTTEIALGGEIGYDFGKVTVQAQVTRDVLRTANGVNQAKETRGWLRLIIPLYVAPTPASPVIARY